MSVSGLFCIAFEKNFPLVSCLFKNAISFGISSNSIHLPSTDSTAAPISIRRWVRILRSSSFLRFSSCFFCACWSQARLAIFRPVELTNFRTYKNSQCTFSFRFTYYLMVIIHQLLLLQFHICFHDSCFL